MQWAGEGHLGMCRIDILISVWFRFGKNSDLVRNEFGLVWFGSDIIVIYYSCNSRYYNDSG